MGNNFCCGEQHRNQRQVTQLPNTVPAIDRYRLYRNQSVRLSEISVRKSERNRYIFTMGIKDSPDIHLEVPVINEVVHCVITQNYQLKIESRMIVDIFSKRYEDMLIQTKNQKTGLEFSMKIIPFKSYTSSQFRHGLYELWLNRKMIKNSNFVKLMDYFIYGMNEEEQAFVFLFQKCTTSLANIAQYRKEAYFGWRDKEKLQIIQQIFDSYNSLFEKNIVHRDVRPSNVYFVPSSNSFVFGNLSKARVIRNPFEGNDEDDDLLTVCGIPHFSCHEVANLTNNKQSIGYYKAIKQDYAGLKSIINILQTCEILDRNPDYNSEQVQKIQKMLNNEIPFNRILQYIKKTVSEESVDRNEETGDKQIAKSASYILAHTHKQVIQDHTFKTYGYLGYSKQFTNKAHRMLQINIQNDRQLENAFILKKLGQFYERKGSRETQYFYNAFILFIKRAQTKLKYGYPEKADLQLDQAKQTYLKINQTLESQLPRIQINRVASLLQLQNKNQKGAAQIINETMVKAAKENIPVQKQCKILLAYGRIVKKNPQTKEEALKKLMMGLNICENKTVFESPPSCRIYKSHFLYEIGQFYLDQILEKHNPKKHRNQQAYGVQIKGKAEAHLRSSLQIRQKQTVDDIDVSQCLTSLGLLYYNDENFYDAKKYFYRSLIRMENIKDSINPLTIVNGLYMKGSSCYYLQEYSQAANEYENAIKILQRKRPDQFLLKYNIQGNHALTMMNMGLPEGRIKLDEAMQNIKHEKGEMSYDYACLKASLMKLQSNK